MMMAEKKQKQVEKQISKVAGDGLGTLVGVPIAQTKINFHTFTNIFFQNRPVTLPIDSYESN